MEEQLAAGAGLSLADLWGVIGPPSCILPERFGLLSESATIHPEALASTAAWEFSECSRFEAFSRWYAQSS